MVMFDMNGFSLSVHLNGGGYVTQRRYIKCLFPSGNTAVAAGTTLFVSSEPPCSNETSQGSVKREKRDFLNPNNTNSSTTYKPAKKKQPLFAIAAIHLIWLVVLCSPQPGAHRGHGHQYVRRGPEAQTGGDEDTAGGRYKEV